MKALVRGYAHKNPDEMNEDEFLEAWEQTRYYLSVVHQVKFE